MTAHGDRVRQAEEAAGVYDGTAWEAGDLVAEPTSENLPEGTVLIDGEGDAWKILGGEWCVPGAEGPVHPARLYGPYTIAWLPGEGA